MNDALTVTFFVNPVVNAGNDTTICAGTTIPISGTITGGASTGTWSVSPSNGGTFGNTNNLQTTFTPSIGGTITLTLTSANPTGPCNSVNDSKVITVEPAVVVNAGGDQQICLVQAATVSLTGTITGGATTGTWSSSGNGTFSSTSSLSTVYTPDSQDIVNLSVTLTLTSADP